MSVGLQTNIEKDVIEQLQGYKRLCGRIKMLHIQPIGMGMSIEHDGSEDVLQALHKKLKGLPSYTYLTDKQQKLELTAYAYLERYPLGTKSQLNEVKKHGGVDAEDKANLKELARQIQKVIDARAGENRGYEAVFRRLDELQAAVDEKELIDSALSFLAEYKPEYAELLRSRYIDGLTVEEAAKKLGIVRKTFDRWREKAIEEYVQINSMSQSCP